MSSGNRLECAGAVDRWYLGGSYAASISTVDELSSDLARAVQAVVSACFVAAPEMRDPALVIASSVAGVAVRVEFGPVPVVVTAAGWSAPGGAAGDLSLTGLDALAQVVASRVEVMGGSDEQDQTGGE